MVEVDLGDEPDQEPLLYSDAEDEVEEVEEYSTGGDTDPGNSSPVAVTSPSPNLDPPLDLQKRVPLANQESSRSHTLKPPVTMERDSDNQEGDNCLSLEAQHEPDIPSKDGTNPIGANATGNRHRARSRPRTMGRYPYLAEYRPYLEHIRPFYQDSTHRRIQKNLKTIGLDLQTLRDQNLISTTNPGKLIQDDIGQLIQYWRTRPSRYGKPLDVDTQARYLSDLAGLMEFQGNGIVSAMRRQKKLRLPKAMGKPIDVLSGADVQVLKQAAEGMDKWWGSVARFLVAFLPATGLRRKEIRLAKLQHLDLQRWRILVAHPKGEGSWATAADAWIAPEGRQAVLDFLQERKAFLGTDNHDALIPYRRQDGTLDHWPDAMLGQLKGELERRAGVKFHLKTFRATFAQNAKDRGTSIEAVSKALRHRNTLTTERYYARIRADDAFSELEQAYMVQKSIKHD